MIDRTLTIIAIQEEYLSTISKQVQEIAGDMIKIRSITVKDLAREAIPLGETVLLSGEFILQLVKPFLTPEIKYIVAKRGLNFVNMRELLSLPKGQHILIVNDNKLHTDEAVQALSESVFEHYYYPFYPDSPVPVDIDYVVTPGEKQLVPQGWHNIIDIGPRVLDLETIYELFNHFGLIHNHSLLTKR
ncbi:MAG: Fis family transcriptional regulator, partial [Bacilli bacterium]